MSPFIFVRLQEDIDNCFAYEIRFDIVNFPANGPVMQTKTVKWEPSTEKMYVRDGVLKDDVNMALLPSWRRWPLPVWPRNYLQVRFFFL